MTAPARRTLEVTTRDGHPYKIKGKPRADVLHYPDADMTTVLVRRTHDPATARVLAEDRWTELRDQGLVEGELGTGDRSVRAGWWATRTRRWRPGRGEAVDEGHRVVVACTDTDHAAGPGIEYRP